jgi:hypothetical protein
MAAIPVFAASLSGGQTLMKAQISLLSAFAVVSCVCVMAALRIKESN